MSELRLNPATEEWVIIAGERGGRPHEYSRPRRRRRVPSYLASCPFCPGNEEMTPSPVLEVPNPRQNGRWLIRAFENKFPALGPDLPPRAVSEGKMLLSLRGEGAHEVLVESPVHNRFPAIRDASEMAPLIMAYQERYNTLMAHPSTEYVLIFKNHGEEAGTSIEHPHSQIIASPVVPESAWRRGDIARGHYRRTGRCLHCQMADEELQLGSRIVYRDGRFVVFHPFAAARCAETWIIPLDHQPSFGEAGADELAHFASVLGQTLRQLSAAFGDPDYNYALHSAPKGEESKPYQHWHLQLIPRLTKAAGFELGSGIYINTSPPEQTAEAMRRAPV